MAVPTLPKDQASPTPAKPPAPQRANEAAKPSKTPRRIALGVTVLGLCVIGTILWVSPWSWSRVDWSATGTMLGGIAGILAAVATAVGAFFVYEGLSTWQKELRGSKGLDAVLRGVGAVVTFTDHLTRAQGFFSSWYHMTPLIAERLPDRTNIKAEQHLLETVMSAVENASAELLAVAHEVRRLWGRDAEQRILDLHGHWYTFSMAVSRYKMMRFSGDPGPDTVDYRKVLFSPAETSEFIATVKAKSTETEDWLHALV